MEEHHEQRQAKKDLGNAEREEAGNPAHALYQILPSWEVMFRTCLSTLNSPVLGPPFVPWVWSSLDALKTSQST